MMERSLIGNVEFVNSINPAAHTANTNGNSADLNASRSWTFLINHGTWTDGTHVIHFEESDDNSTWTAIAAANLDGYNDAAVQELDSGGQTYTISDNSDAGETTMVAYIGGRRYIRARLAPTGTSTGAVYSVQIAKAGLRNRGRGPMTASYNATNTP